MEPTTELRARLRRMLNEKILPGKTDADTRFLDIEIDDILQEAPSFNRAVSQGWREIAGMARREMGTFDQITTGDESYKYRSLKELYESAEKQCAEYAALAEADELKEKESRAGSVMLTLERPVVI